MSLSPRAVALQGIGFAALLVAAQGLETYAPAQANAWDTSQGVARNLARNLSFSRVEDVDVRPAPVQSRSGGGATTAYANAYVVTQSDGAYSGARPIITDTEIHANAFTTPLKPLGVTSGVSLCVVHANGYCDPDGSGVAVGVRPVSAVADGVGYPGVRAHLAGVAQKVVATGVHNPTDEQIGALVALLTRRGKHATNRPLVPINNRRT